MTPEPDIPALAERMLGDYDRRTPGTPFADRLRLSIDDAYRLQRAVADRRERRGERVVGYKVGCVCRENQRQNGLTQPVYGRLWSTEQHASGVRLRTGQFANLAIEGELGLTLARDLEPDAQSVATVAAAVDRVFTVIELHHLVRRGDDPGPELIANNAIHAGVVRATGIEPPASNTEVGLTVTCGGRTVGTWSDRRWPDDVLAAVPWLVAELAKEGRRLERGQMILTGAWGPPIPVVDRETGPSADRPVRVEATSAPFGAVAAQFW